MRKACFLWASCVKNKGWPGYSDYVETLELSNNANRLCISEMAKRYDISRSFVYKIVNAYQLEVRKFGREKTIDMADFANAMRWYNGNERDVA